MDPRKPEETFGRYRLFERIGYGGMAEVFRASYTPTEGFEKVLVLKRILPHLCGNDRFVKMFRDEASITVNLTHNNIVQVFDFGEVNGIYFLAMEFVRGCTLRELMNALADANRTLPIEVAAYIALEVSRGLAYAHSACDPHGKPLGIVHRDLNPPNVLLSVEGEVKITDFGIARAATRLEQTEAGKVKGKISYIAPEVLKRATPDHRADLWALGCVLFEMIEGQPPYGYDEAGDAVPATMVYRILEEPVPALNNYDVPPALSRALESLLQKDPNLRPLSADEAGILISSVVESGARRILQELLNDVVQSTPTPVDTSQPSLAGLSDSGWNQSTGQRIARLDDAISDELDGPTARNLIERKPAQEKSAGSSLPPLLPSPSVPTPVPMERAGSQVSLSEFTPTAPRPKWLVPAALMGGLALVTVVGYTISQMMGGTNIAELSPTTTPVVTATNALIHTPVSQQSPVNRPTIVAMAITSAPPGAEVKVNNKFIGKTPTYQNVEPGQMVHLDVRLPNRKPHIDIVRAPSGVDAFTVAVELPPIQFGVLQLTVNEPSAVYVDSLKIGNLQTQHRLRLEAGIYTIVVTNRDASRRCDLKFKVQGNRRTLHRVNLAECSQ